MSLKVNYYCFEDEESSIGYYPDYPEFSDADHGL
jgi:hypothetical protein